MTTQELLTADRQAANLLDAQQLRLTLAIRQAYEHDESMKLIRR